MKKILRFFLIAFGGILFLLAAIFIFLLINSPGKATPFTDNKGQKIPESISEIETVNINGLDQKMIIRGSDTSKPVLLYLHGGPGDPEFPFVKQFNPGIEDIFVVCYWDQRGAGLSYSKEVPPATMNLRQFVDDAGKVTEYLLHRFNREKIYLLGHSWGTMLGSFTAGKFPDYYYAFISVGQVGDQKRSEKISYDFVLARSREINDLKAIKKLEEIGSPPYSQVDALGKMIACRKYVIKYGGAVREGNIYPRAIKTLFFCREYRITDKINYLRGMQLAKIYLWNTILETNMFRAVPSQQIPVYMIHGISDYQTSYQVAKEYFDSLQAPVKKFFTFENSAHSPVFEEPKKFNGIMKEIVMEQKDSD